MDGLDLVNFFLHDKIAAKIWYRDIEWKTEDSTCILYKSKLDTRQQFILSLFDDDTAMIGYLNHGYDVYLSSENMIRARSMSFSLWFDMKENSFLRIMYRREVVC